MTPQAVHTNIKIGFLLHLHVSEESTFCLVTYRIIQRTRVGEVGMGVSGMKVEWGQWER